MSNERGRGRGGNRGGRGGMEGGSARWASISYYPAEATLTRAGEVLGATVLLLQVVSRTLAGGRLPWARARLLE